MSAKLAFWNVRGLNDPDKHNIFTSWLAINDPLFVALLETHVKEQYLSQLMSKICHGWNYSFNHLSDDDGRILIIWKHPAVVNVVHQTRQSMTCTVKLPNSASFFFTAIYASNLRGERSDMWVELIDVHLNFALQDVPWVIGGDFNQILHHAEHSLAEVNLLDTQMLEFRNCLLQLEVFDLRFQGPLFTWSNHQPLSPLAKTLDRLLVNNPTISAFPNCVASFLPPNFSDHTPCLLNLAHSLPHAGTKPFKFFNYLTKHPRFLQVVQEAWIQVGNFASDMTNLFWKIKCIKRVLKQLNKDNFSNIQERVTEANRLLLDVQVIALQNPSPHSFQLERDMHQKWLFLRQIEECYFRQKSRIQWLKEGDQNSPYFFRICQSRMNYNSVRSFLLPSGVLVTDPEQMCLIAINHFKNILAPDVIAAQPILSPPDWFQTITNFSCSLLHQQMMTSIPSAAEISYVLLKLNPNKAPGPDGLTSGFYKASWDVVGAEVVVSIQHFFTSSFLPTSANSTILSLVPKRPGASAISDFRPIACLNTTYKVISRLLVRRLKPLLPSLIVSNQTAFVRDRLLIENTILASELVNGYHKSNGPKRITIKVDIAKAFDTVSWEFLFNCLQGLRIPTTYLGWLKACVCTPTYMIGYNGKVNGYFKGRRGLRQGDPLSPYLFVIAMNVLSLMLNKAAEEEKFSYHFKCETSRLTHLCFADDLLIFINGSISSVQNVLQVLHEFEL